MEEWGKWFRESSDKFLLAIGIVFMMSLTLHLIHRGHADAAQLQFLNGITNTLVGGLLGLITGSVLRKNNPPDAPREPTPAIVVQPWTGEMKDNPNSPKE